MDTTTDTTARFRTAYWTVAHHLDLVRLKVWEERGVTLPQLRLLFALRAHPGVTTNNLAKQLGLTPPTVSGQVDKLARAGLVARGQHPDDRRIVPLELTDAGRDIIGAISQETREYLGGLAAGLGDDLTAVTAALEQLAAVITRQPTPTISATEATHS